MHTYLHTTVNISFSYSALECFVYLYLILVMLTVILLPFPVLDFHCLVYTNIYIQRVDMYIEVSILYYIGTCSMLKLADYT